MEKKINMDQLVNMDADTEESQRFTMLVEEVEQLEKQCDVAVTGYVHGRVTNGEAGYIINPGNTMSPAEVTSITDEEGNAVEIAENGRVRLTLTNTTGASKFSVVTNMEAGKVVDMSKPIENPYLLGLSMEYERFSADPFFSNLLVYELCHANFIVPFEMDKEIEKNEDGTIAEGSAVNMKFYAIHKTDDQEKKIFPVFTDWQALKRWKNIYNEGQVHKVLLISFPKAVEIMRNGHVGLAVNPFGPQKLFFPSVLIDKITEMKGYQQEFGEDKKVMRTLELANNTKITVEIPAQSAEVKAIRDALVKCGTGRDDIKRIDLLVKTDETNMKTYFCIVDCPEKNADAIFDGIDKIIMPFAKSIRVIDYITYEKAVFLRKVLGETLPVYITYK